MTYPARDMDESTIPRPFTVRMPDGFPGQRMRVLPRPLVAHALHQPTTEQVLVSDVGFFPRAAGHGRERPAGARETIVIVCSAGSGTCRLPDGTFDVRAGQALLIPAGTPHAYEANLDDPWTIWWMHVVGRAVPALVAAAGATPQRPVIRLADPPRVVSLIDQVIRRMERDETAATLLAASGAAWHALCLVAADRHLLPAERTDGIAAVIEHLQATSATHTSVGELAGVAGLSASHFAAEFRRATGSSVVEYQTRVRMGRARELLDTTDRTIASVAREVGYADPLYFSRQFRRIHGIAPSAYRQREP